MGRGKKEYQDEWEDDSWEEEGLEEDSWDDDWEDDAPEKPEKRGRKGDGNGGHKGGRGKVTLLVVIFLVIAIGVFGYSAARLFTFYQGYKAGEDEYASLSQDFAQVDETNEPEKKDETNQSEKQGESETEQETGERETEMPTSALTSVKALEDESTLEDKISKMQTADVLENNEKKTLPKMKNPIKFDELRKINPDVIGWIRVSACGISYPIAQGKDNDYYLHRSFRGEEVYAGCIFESYENSKSFTDMNTIIYGHNMKDGSMFASLKKFWDDPETIRVPYFWIFTPDMIFQYRIFSCSLVNKISTAYNTRFTLEYYQNFIDSAIERSEVDCGDVKVTPEDRIVTLSTCTSDDEVRRIVQGKLIQIYATETSPEADQLTEVPEVTGVSEVPEELSLAPSENEG